MNKVFTHTENKTEQNLLWESNDVQNINKLLTKINIRIYVYHTIRCVGDSIASVI